MTVRRHTEACCVSYEPNLDVFYDLRLGRNDLPKVLFEMDASGRFDDRQNGRLLLRRAIEDAWTGAEFPLNHAEPWEWTEMFYKAGFVTDCSRMARPRRPLRVWRGYADEFNMRGMSWTVDRDVAVRFARARSSGDGVPMVAEAVVDAGSVLAMFPHSREEREVVIDAYAVDHDDDPATFRIDSTEVVA